MMLQPITIHLSGCMASGKTTLMGKIQRKYPNLNQNKMVCCDMDEFFLSTEFKYMQKLEKQDQFPYWKATYGARISQFIYDNHQVGNDVLLVGLGSNGSPNSDYHMAIPAAIRLFLNIDDERLLLQYTTRAASMMRNADYRKDVLDGINPTLGSDVYLQQCALDRQWYLEHGYEMVDATKVLSIIDDRIGLRRKSEKLMLT